MRRRAVAVTAALVLFLTAVVFLPVLGNGFVDWDDGAYILRNAPVAAGLTPGDIMANGFVRGAESVLYGSDAMTSVVQLWSATGRTAVPEVRFGADGGTFGTARGYASVAGARGRLGVDSDDLRAGGGRRKPTERNGLHAARARFSARAA